MGYSFNGSSDEIAVADGAALTLPDGDWTIGGWIYPDDFTGSGFQWLILQGLWGATPSINILIGETSSGITPEGFRFYSADDDGTLLDVQSSSSVLSATTWQHLIIQRSGTTTTLYVDNSSVGSTALSTYDGVNVGSAMYFSRADLDSTWRFPGDMEDWFKVDRALNAQERQALANGFSSRLIAPDASWRFTMDGAYEEVGRLGVTVSGATLVEGQLLQQPAPSLTITAPSPVSSKHGLALMGVG